jgi:hypothetical protein
MTRPVRSTAPLFVENRRQAPTQNLHAKQSALATGPYNDAEGDFVGRGYSYSDVWPYVSRISRFAAHSPLLTEWRCRS